MDTINLHHLDLGELANQWIEVAANDDQADTIKRYAISKYGREHWRDAVTNAIYRAEHQKQPKAQ